ncbi:PREDICTED: myosin heavy chain, muscle-like [Rhagoletis zephyria]|uniref:myosin heavy chain, muscle-like n=1 Tax=Rhagoletis zephyria TaxID=28612 RepID=UPI00081149CF|nr:PREDICTED: myosin heavy chain, muscle-like [Rhagoletis zephyria]
MSPVCTLSSESKRIIRQAQVPILQASPRVVHFLYEARIEELEEELEKERKNRIRAEKARTDLSREVEDMGLRLEEAGGTNSQQSEVNRRREAEIGKLKRELEVANTNHDQEVFNLRKRSNDILAELQEQIELLTKAKAKTDKDNAVLTAEVADLQATAENATKLQANAEKHSKHVEGQLAEANKKVDEANGRVGDLEATNKKLANQKAEVEKQFQEAEAQLASIEKIKDQLKKELEDTKGLVTHETQERLALLSKYRNLEIDLESARKLIEDDENIKNNLHNQLSKAHTEIQQWKAKWESAGYVPREEMEEMRKKLTLRLQEADDHIEQLNIKNSSLEKAKLQLTNEVEELANELERSHVMVVTLEKKVKAQEKELLDWKQRCDDMENELDASQKECRNLSTELFKLKAAHDELQEQHESTKRENKNLQDEVKDLLDQLAESSRLINELELTRKRLTMEKEELQSALAEAETALEVEENKVYAAQQALEQARLEHDRRLREKEEEFEGVRRNMQKVLDQMQVSLEAEARGRQEALKAKKKLEGDVVELELALDAANKAHAEAQAFIHKQQGQIKELQVTLEHEIRAKEEAQELWAASERKCQSLHNELDQTRTLLELADRKCRNLENELGEVNELNSELSAANAALSNSKRKLEGEMQILKADFDEALNEVKLLDDKCKKAILDAARLADELKEEQDHAQAEEKLRRSLEETNKELQVRLDEAEQAAMVAGRKTIAKLESRVRELTQELESEQRKYSESSKNLRKADRKIKEAVFELDEAKKNAEHLQDLAEKLSAKVKTYKRQIEEAEEIAALNLAKYRKLQTELEDAEERADSTQANLSKLRAKTRCSISMNRAASPGPKYSDTQQLQAELL